MRISDWSSDVCSADLERLLPGITVIERPRLSQLFYAGQKKITRLPQRPAIVAFSADEVYAIAELIRRQRGGAAVVLGALSPPHRNAQGGLYREGRSAEGRGGKEGVRTGSYRWF